MGTGVELTEEYKATEILLESFRKISELSALLRKFRVQSGSSLQGDDSATPYEMLSSQVDTCIQGAMDNVNALQALMVDGTTLPAYAHFSFLRNALEFVGTGFWVLGPSSRDERVIRSLQLAFEARRDYLNVVNELKQRPEKMPANDEIRLLLQAQRDCRPSIASRKLDPPSISARLRTAQDFCSEQPNTIIGFWRLTSGAVHGRRAILRDLLEHEVLERSPEVVLTSSTSGVIVVSNILRHIEVYLFELSILFITRGKPH